MIKGYAQMTLYLIIWKKLWFLNQGNQGMKLGRIVSESDDSLPSVVFSDSFNPIETRRHGTIALIPGVLERVQQEVMSLLLISL